MTTELRPYQHDLVQQVLRTYKQGGKRICVVSPTGSGKTIVAAALIQKFVDQGLRVMFQVHLDCLIGQTRAKLWDVGYRDPKNLGFIKAGWNENRSAPVQIASQQTLLRRDWWHQRRFHVIFLDECHTTAFVKAAQQTHKYFPRALYIGLTATPMRMKKTEGLRDHFDHCIAAPVPQKLTEMGYLAPMDYYSLPADFIDLSRVRVTAGEFNSGDLGIACNHPQSIDRCLEEYQKHGQGQPALIFAVTVAHAEALARRFNAGGVLTKVVTAKTPSEERRQLYEAFKQGRIQALASVNCISMGFDVPNATIGIVARPTKSEGLWYQMVGRLMRPAPGKEKGVILDIAGNTWRFGIPDEIQAYSLDFSQLAGAGGPPFKTCDHCGLLNLISAKVCKGCGTAFPVQEKKPVIVPLAPYSQSFVGSKQQERSTDQKSLPPAEPESNHVNVGLPEDISGQYIQLLAEQQHKVEWNVENVALESERKGTDYTKLRDLLKAQQWKEANHETYRLMIKIVGRTESNYFRQEDLLNFPCKDLKTIDRLWVQASQGRYGFSVQKEIYVRCGAKLDGNHPGKEIWEKFGKEVGWRVNNSWQNYDKLIWGSIRVPGHLPIWIWRFVGGYWVRGGGVEGSLLSHRDL
ncbi:MAG: GUN4 domain-containing protein [Prochlorothrix sp.]|nr:GUN4 domain-containing protein [Prochlorothrix sp.]